MTAVAPSPARALRSMTSDAQQLRARLQHADDLLISRIARAQAAYIEDVKRAYETIALEQAPANDQSVVTEPLTA